METFLQNLIPVSTGVWVGFFLLPAAAAFVGQLWLCLWVRQKMARFIPLYAAGALILCVGLYRFTGFLSPLIGGFVALLLLGTAGVLFIGSGLGWVVYGICDKKKPSKR